MVHAPPRPPAGAPRTRINLYSDTQTRPTAAMKDAMMRAEVGDEQHGDDPTVHALCDRMAALMGKEAAMFLPSGTMCNVVAILTHCQKGDEVVAHETAHILTSEGGTHAALTGAQIMGLRGPRGMFSADDAARRDPPAHPLHPAPAAAGGRADRQYRRRRGLAAGAAQRRRRDRA